MNKLLITSGLVCKKHSSIQSKHSNCTNAINVSITRSSDSSGRRGDSAGGSAVIIIACFTSVVPTFLVAYQPFLASFRIFPFSQFICFSPFLCANSCLSGSFARSFDVLSMSI